jgi:hypothetical protein
MVGMVAEVELKDDFRDDADVSLVRGEIRNARNPRPVANV